MVQTFDEFVEEVKDGIESFAGKYREKAAIDCNGYPLKLDDGDEGVWVELFLEYMDTGIVLSIEGRF
jgi:hypothetical protein